MFNIIYLLLLGNDENSDLASLLIGLVKEKKVDKMNYMIIFIKI